MQKPVLALPGTFISTASANGLNVRVAPQTLIVISMIYHADITVILSDGTALTGFVMQTNAVPMNGLRSRLKIRIVVNMRVLEN